MFGWHMSNGLDQDSSGFRPSAQQDVSLLRQEIGDEPCKSTEIYPVAMNYIFTSAIALCRDMMRQASQAEGQGSHYPRKETDWTRLGNGTGTGSSDGYVWTQ